MLKHAILGFLKYRPHTGYEIKQTMDKSTGHFWHVKQSQIYTTLKKLEKDGLVASHPEPQESRPDRRVYIITESGGKELQVWLSQPVTKIDNSKVILLLKLFFSGKENKETILTQLRLQRSLHERQFERYKIEPTAFIEEIVALQPDLKLDSLLWEATRRFGELHEGIYMEWLDETISMVEKEFQTLLLFIHIRRSKMKRFRLSLMVISFTFFVSIAYAQTGTLTVEISEIQGKEGVISVGLYTSAENFPATEKSYSGRIIKVTGEKAVATFQDIPAGTYAIAVFHDTNSNSKLDTNFLKIPNEGYAFSNNVFGTFGPPDFEDASFKLDGNKTVEIKMGYQRFTNNASRKPAI